MQCSFARHPSFARLFRSSPSQKYSFLRCFFYLIFHTSSYYPRSPISLVASGSSVSVLDVDRATSSFQFHDTQKMNQCFHRISSSRLCPYTAPFHVTSPPFASLLIQTISSIASNSDNGMADKAIRGVCSRHDIGSRQIE
ncbi:Uncharacterized protein APZ42_016823 [Daphnia magna]|uniref:Uncharacterized protein n=1 Tax=Daphnia magna TaxID=35525 RepID=A0A165A6M8_9CRUS|nr:Uncharacterized protein APZ42_016823 [Daphnia magna]